MHGRFTLRMSIGASLEQLRLKLSDVALQQRFLINYLLRRACVQLLIARNLLLVRPLQLGYLAGKNQRRHVMKWV